MLLRNLIKYGNPYAVLTMHRVLYPESHESLRDGGISKFTYLEDLILSAVSLPSDPRVLDAGCGLGGTIFRWHEQIGGNYDGLTLSKVQVRVARRAAQRLGVDKQCRFYQKSYNEPLPEKYDAVVAIESLLYSGDLRMTVEKLSGVLRPGGVIIVADDVSEGLVEPESAKEIDLLRSHWRLSGIPRREELNRIFDDAGLRLLHERDLTQHMKVLPSACLNVLMGLLRSLYIILPVRPLRAITSAYVGGIALQNFHLEKKVSYRLLVYQRHGGRSTAP